MSQIYQADVFDANGNLLDTLEVGGDDGSLPPTEMSPDTAREELEQLAKDEYGDRVARVTNVRVKGRTP